MQASTTLTFHRYIHDANDLWYIASQINKFPGKKYVITIYSCTDDNDMVQLSSELIASVSLHINFIVPFGIKLLCLGYEFEIITCIKLN